MVLCKFPVLPTVLSSSCRRALPAKLALRSIISFSPSLFLALLCNHQNFPHPIPTFYFF